jgi:hypothetical protein
VGGAVIAIIAIAIAIAIAIGYYFARIILLLTKAIGVWQTF